MPRLHSDSEACPHTPELFSGSSLLEVRNGRLLCRIALLLFFCYLLSGIPLDFAKPSSRGGWNHSWPPCAKLTSLWMGLAERIGDLPAFPAVAGSVLSDSDGKEYNSEAEL